MPKTLPVVPEEVRKPGKITFKDIPVNTYQKAVKDESKNFTKKSSLTILSIGATLYRALDAVDILKEKYKLSAELIDARSLVPFNYDKVIESVKKTGRIVITGDACERNSFMRNLASNITELCFDYLDAPPVVVGAYNWITPPSELTDSYYPQPGWILDVIHERILPLKNHICSYNFTELEQVRRNKLGV